MPTGRWDDQATAELDAIIGYILIADQAAAVRLAERIRDAAARLVDFPRRGREIGSGLLQLSPVYPYLVRYKVEDDLVTIVSVRHGARDEG